MIGSFTYFGLSTSAEKNTYEQMENEIILRSAVYDAEGTTVGKGGKFMPFFDGISYFYWTVPTDTSYFSLSCDFQVDYLNPNPDGQEGFGIILRDSLGAMGDSENCYMANSCSVLATAFPDHEDKAVRDCLGYRFVWDLKSEDVANNRRGAGQSHAQPFEPTPEKIVQGGIYRLRLWRDEAGFHVSWVDKDLCAHFPHPNQMAILNEEEWYIGMAVARGCNVTVRNICWEIGDKIDAENPNRYPMPSALPALEILNKHLPADEPVRLQLFSRTTGQVKLLKQDEELTSFPVEASRITASPELNLPAGKHRLMYEWQAGDERLTGSIEIESRALVNEIFVCPEGTERGLGTVDDPLDLLTAIRYIRSGGRISLAAGTYSFDDAIEIEYGNSGSVSARKSLICKEGRAVIDFTGKGGPFYLNGSYWELSGITICHTGDNRQGLKIGGSHNLLTDLDVHSNGDTGMQISSREDLHADDWPAGNRVSFCRSFNNADPGLNNADGFAAKLACGAGNIFEGCLSYNNIDDGWDLYTRIANGPIAPVEIHNCLCYRNGHNQAKTMYADGNGFKLGGEGIPIPHRLTGSLAWENDADGITSNSNPAIQLEQCVSIRQLGRNYAIYGQGSPALAAIANGCISIAGTEKDLLPPHLKDGEGVTYSDRTKEEVLQEWMQAFRLKYPDRKTWLNTAISVMLATAN